MKKLYQIIKLIILCCIISGSLALSSEIKNIRVAEASVEKPILKEKNITLFVGYEKYKICIKNLSKEAAVTYTSKDNNIISVNKEGVITPISDGNASVLITVKQNKKTYIMTLKAIVKNPFIKFTNYTDYLNVTEHFDFNAQAFGTDSEILWSVSETSVATIDELGTLTPIKAGRINVYAKAKDITAKCTVDIGNNRLYTLDKKLTISESKQILIHLSDYIEGELLSCSVDNPDVLNANINYIEDKKFKLYINVRKIGQSRIIIKSSKSNDRLILDIDIVDKDRDRNKMSSTEVFKQCNSSTVEISVHSKYDEILGSGFFIDTNKVVTNYHVIKGAKQIQVTASDKKVHDVKVILGYDEKLDLAILEIDDCGKPLKLCQEESQEGDDVYTLGSPLGLTGTFAKGMVTAAKREFDGVSFIQIDAAISPGNSGGPLVNSFGEVIGINTMNIQGGQNLNFAINIDELQKVAINKSLTVAEYYDLYEKEFLTNVIKEDPDFVGSLSKGQPIEAYVGVSGCISSIDDYDTYSFTVEEPGWFECILESEKVNEMRFSLFENGRLVINYVKCNKDEPFIRVRYYLDMGRHTILIDSISSDPATYLFTARY